jgi:hypothetical protein
MPGNNDEAQESEKVKTRRGFPVMEQLPTPHNNFFQFALSHLPNARSLIETQLSPAALAELDLDTLQLETGSFIDADLREKFSDLLMSVRLAGSDAESEGKIQSERSAGQRTCRDPAADRSVTSRGSFAAMDSGHRSIHHVGQQGYRLATVQADA